MTSTTEKLYMSEYDRLKGIRKYAYSDAEAEPDLLIDAMGVLLAHGRLINQLMQSAVLLEQDLQKAQDRVEVLKERVMFLDEQLDAYQSPGLTE